MDETHTSLELHRDALVIDTHCDTLKCLHPLFTHDRASMWADRSQQGLGVRSELGHVDIPRLTEGGVNCQVFAISSLRDRTPPNALRTALEMISILDAECIQNASSIQTVSDVENIVSAVNQGKIAAILSVEGADIIEGRPSILRILYRLGVRMVGLVHSRRNLLADGVADARTNGGLSTLGVEVIEELNRLGLLIDVSHLNDAGFWDVMDLVKRPVIASHSNCRAVCSHPRNLTDDQIRALAQRGGVIGINFAPSFIHPVKATIERLVDHIDHIVEIVGTKYVGLGSDFDGIPSTPEGLSDVSQMPRITQELIQRRYTETEIRQILGLNHFRVFKQVWQ
ncbi:MAG: dipeptidase [Candidatus Bathyarchaeota archaeon]|nr:dipeptidase [Candidatus Bathyarchaeota archaeon]